jgi:hypothetical protein
MFGVGVLYDYFAASSDEAAAATIDLSGGPGGAEPFSPELAAAIKAGDRDAMRRFMMPKVRLSEHGLHVLSVKGIDPVVELGSLEALLTGTPYDDIVARDRHGSDVADADDGERLVLTLSDEFQHALNAADDEQLTAVATPWSQTEEFLGHGEPEVLAHFIRQLAHLARHATSTNSRLYCWVCV